MTKLFRIALAQFPAVPMDPEKNLFLAQGHCRAAKEAGADLILFPEMWSTGYAFPDPNDDTAFARWEALAVSETSPYLSGLRETAKALSLGVAATCLLKNDPTPQNAAFLFGPDGSLLLQYAKVHLCAWGTEGYLTPGDGFPVCRFPLKDGDDVTLGFMICYDREFPESARLLMLNGAEILLVPNACDMNPARLGQLSSRAFENMVGVAMANYPGEGFGRSVAFSPVVFDGNGRYVDNTVSLAGEEETLLLADFDLEELRDYRRRETWGNAYRRPELYGALTETEAKAPFAGRPRFKK